MKLFRFCNGEYSQKNFFFIVQNFSLFSIPLIPLKCKNNCLEYLARVVNVQKDFVNKFIILCLTPARRES